MFNPVSDRENYFSPFCRNIELENEWKSKNSQKIQILGVFQDEKLDFFVRWKVKGILENFQVANCGKNFSTMHYQRYFVRKGHPTWIFDFF